MPTFPESMLEYRKQLHKGALQAAYRGLMEYLLALKAHLQKKYPDYHVSGGLYPGYMDMSYFSFFPQSFKDRNLKVAVVFVHEAYRFEVWLAGVNKQVQTRYWKLFKDSGWYQYPLVPNPQGADAILEHTLVADPDFSDLEALTQQIERGTLKFIWDLEKFLSEQ